MLQLISQTGLEVGDMLLIAPGTNQQEMVQIVAFGSVILGVPLRFTHALGTPVVLAHTYATGTPQQATFIRNEAARHVPPRQRIESHGGLTDDNDANSLQGFIDDQAWSEAEREHQKARHRRRNRQAFRPRARPLPIPPHRQSHNKATRKIHMPTGAYTRRRGEEVIRRGAFFRSSESAT